MFLIKNLKCSRLPRQFTQINKLPVCSHLPSVGGTNLASCFSSSSNSANVAADQQSTVPAKKSNDVLADAVKTYGQPTASTHPHLINKDHLVPGVSVQEFQSRRNRLMAGIQKYALEHVQTVNRNHLVIIPSSTKKFMSDKIPYVFRQNSDFYYLTGCLEPDSVLVMTIDDHGIAKSMLFMRPKDKNAELWDGSRTGVENAPQMFGVDEAYPVEQFSAEVGNRIRTEAPLIWYEYSSSDLEKITKEVRTLAGALPMLNSPAHFVQSMRLFKSPAEQSLMRNTCQIASDAINAVMHEARPGHSEHHIFAMVDFNCRMLNANHLAYPPVVASGNNGTTIHYINNSQLTKSGDLVLMDAGCEYAGYSSDITRTWPISGKFTEPQRVLYDVVQQVQTELIGMLLKEGGDTLDNLFETMCVKLGKYLQEVCLVPKSISDTPGLAKAGYKFCPHHVSHYLGMDVHDTPLMPRSMRLIPGMVFTVEPGLYIGHDRTDVPKEFRGMGIRIEDDVLITPDGKIEVLTAACIKERSLLENLNKS